MPTTCTASVLSRDPSIYIYVRSHLYGLTLIEEYEKRISIMFD